MEKEKTLVEKVKEVNEILLKGEPKNITKDKFTGFTGYKSQYVIDSMNIVFGLGGWGFKDIYNKSGDGEVVAKVRVWVLDGEKEISRTAYGSKQNHKRASGDGWNMSWGNCKKSAQTDAIKKAFSYLSIGNRAYHGELKI